MKGVTERWGPLIPGTNIKSTLHLELDYEFTGSVFIVGDIHGRYKALKQTLSEAGYESGRDILIATGDLADRGRDSLSVVSSFLFNPDWYSVMGNHDLFFAANANAFIADSWLAKVSEDTALWIQNGGGETISSFGDNIGAIKAAAEKMLEKMPANIEIAMPNGQWVGVLHANTEEFLMDGQITINTLNDYTWDRGIYKRDKAGENESDVKGTDMLFVGHTTFNSDLRVPAIPHRENNRVYMDTSWSQGGSNLSVAALDYTGDYSIMGYITNLMDENDGLYRRMV